MAYKIVKRCVDLLFCLIALPVFLLILIVAGIAIKLEDGGPVFYISERIGKNGRKIYMLKFRSMKINAENILTADGSTYNAKDDPRVTRVGRILRETSIDETAQLINVLKGDMSAIGPRASAWEALSAYKEDEIDKMKVRPGITGYTQAYYRNGIGVRDKRLMDAWYANHVSFLLDFKIFFKTLQTVFKRENIYVDVSVDAEKVSVPEAKELTAKEDAANVK